MSNHARCPVCGSHSDQHLLPPINAKEKTLAMDDRDIKELIAHLNLVAATAGEDTSPHARGIAVGVLLASDLLSRYVAPVAS